jgi:hypothetical protein
MVAASPATSSRRTPTHIAAFWRRGLADVNGGGEKVCLISVLLDRFTKSLSTKGELTMANSNTTTQSFGNLIGDMYARWTLDCVIEIAHAVSIDYVARPEFYRGSDVPDNIADLRSSYGYLRNYPNKGARPTPAT